jgi:anti-sigma-K factor RskA
MIEHAEAQVLTAGYALDALDADDRRDFERHLETCATCRAELDELRETVGALALGTDPIEPPPALRERILAEARRGGEVVPFRTRRMWQGVAAVAAAAALGFAILSVILARSLDDERSARADERAALAVAADPDARRIPLSNGRGSLYVTPAGRAALTFAELRPPPKGKTYEAWVIEGSTPRPAGLFKGRALVLERPVRPGTQVAVTVERAGGVERPTGRPIFSAPA